MATAVGRLGAGKAGKKDAAVNVEKKEKRLKLQKAMEFFKKVPV